MQTRDQAENVVFNQAEVGSQVDRDSRYKNNRQKNGPKTSKSQNQKADVQKYKGAGRNSSRSDQSESQNQKANMQKKTEGTGKLENQTKGCRLTESQITGVQVARHR